MGAWLTPRPGRFPSEKDPAPIVSDDGWVSDPVWTSTENLSFTGIRSPDRPARSESLYLLRFPGSYSIVLYIKVYYNTRILYNCKCCMCA